MMTHGMVRAVLVVVLSVPVVIVVGEGRCGARRGAETGAMVARNGSPTNALCIQESVCCFYYLDQLFSGSRTLDLRLEQPN